MYLRYLVPILSTLARKAPFQFRNEINSKYISRGNWYDRLQGTFPFAKFSTYGLETVTYKDMKILAVNRHALIIDVREPSELAQYGVLPGSINISLHDLEDVFKNMSPDQFYRVYRRSKPTRSSLIVFSCMGGFRSHKAQILAKRLGYTNVKDYSGGWRDWSRRMHHHE